MCDIELYMYVEESGYVDYEFLESLFDHAKIWNNSKEPFMYELMWDILTEQGMTHYQNACEYYKVHIYALALIGIYYEYISSAEYEEYSLSSFIEEEAYDFIPAIALGQLYMLEFKNDEIMDDASEMLNCLVETYMWSVKNAFNAVDLYPVLYSSYHNFTEYDDKEDDYVDIPVSNVKEFRALIEKHWNDIYNDVSDANADAYGNLV